MFFHKQELQYKAEPAAPDAYFARKMQEILGGQYGEITVAMQYGFQAWNSKMPGKYRDLLYGIGSEEFGHVEMIAIMIARLLEKAPATIAAIIGDTDTQQAIVAGAGARPADSNGNPWTGAYVTASGNLLADFTSNANAEMQGRVQVARIFHMTDDPGVKDLLSFLLARDTVHQQQWIAAAQELRDEGIEDYPVPSNFPLTKEVDEVKYPFINFSDGAQASAGRWANGPTPDGNGEFSYLDAPNTSAPMPPPPNPDPRFYGTTPEPNLLDKAKAKIKDVTDN